MIDRIKLYNPDKKLRDHSANYEHSAGWPRHFRPDLLQYYQMYRDVAKQRKLLLIDHYPHWKALLDEGREAYLKAMPDGLHPDVEASKNRIAPYILERLGDKK
jgi:acyl-CoA thioesterase-1